MARFFPQSFGPERFPIFGRQFSPAKEKRRELAKWPDPRKKHRKSNVSGVSPSYKRSLSLTQISTHALWLMSVRSGIGRSTSTWDLFRNFLTRHLDGTLELVMIGYRSTGGESGFSEFQRWTLSNLVSPDRDLVSISFLFLFLLKKSRDDLGNSWPNFSATETTFLLTSKWSFYFFNLTSPFSPEMRNSIPQNIKPHVRSNSWGHEGKLETEWVQRTNVTEHASSWYIFG